MNDDYPATVADVHSAGPAVAACGDGLMVLDDDAIASELTVLFLLLLLLLQQQQ